MHKNIINRTGFIFLLLIFSMVHPTEKTWYNPFAQYNIKHYVMGAITALIIGKIAYDYYISIYAEDTCEQCIEKCQSMYKKIYQEAQQYHHCYYNDARISDWDLKEIITHKNQEPYPFVAYYSSIVQTNVRLKTDLLTVQKELAEINTHKKQLGTMPQSEITDHLQRVLLQLETEGKKLQNLILRTIALMIILKKRIELFKEYEDDCQHLPQTQNNIFKKLNPFLA